MTTVFEITFQGQVLIRSTLPAAVERQVREAAPQIIDAHLDDVMSHLIELEEADPRLSNADLSAKLSTGHTEISIAVEAPADEAMAVGMSAIRSAIHAAGGSTPAWDDEEPSAKWALEDAKSEQKPLDAIGT